MSIPEPFTLTAISAGILTNIATDMLKHRAQALEATLAGRMLKWVGLIEPNFDDRLRDTLSKALELYFERYPQYKLGGVIEFFRDPITAKQIGNYILDRKPIDQDQIQQTLDQRLGGDAITRVLIKQCGLELERIVPDFVECYRLVLGMQLDMPQMALLLAIMDQSDRVIGEMRASEERLKEVTQQIAKRVEAQTKSLQGIADDVKAIKQHLGLDRPRTIIVEELRATLDAAPRGAMFSSDGLRSGYPLHPMPNRYFLAQAFAPDREDLRQALTAGLAEFGMQPVAADDMYWQGHILCKISALIQSTPFGVYQLTVSQNRNVYLELGIAMGLDRPFVLIKDKDAELPPLILGLEYYSITSYLDLRYELGKKLRPFLLDIAHYRTPAMPVLGTRCTAVIAHGDLDVPDFCIPVAKVLAQHHLIPVILGDPTGNLVRYLEREGIGAQIVNNFGNTLLDGTTSAIQTARFGVYRIDKSSQPDAFIALGLAIGLNRPGLLVHRAGNDVPSDVRGLSSASFKSYVELDQLLPKRLNDLLAQSDRQQFDTLQP
jgi:hypothetical protein